MNRDFATAGVAALLGFLTLAVTQGQTAGLDRQGLAAFAAVRGPVGDEFFALVTWLGSGYVLAPAALIGIAMLARRRRWAPAGLLGLGYFGASLTTWWLKMALGRERPALYPTPMEVAALDGSFPSGHTAHAAAFALCLGLLALRHGPRWRAPVVAILAIVVLLVAASRLYLQVHWPSDVLAGLLVAALWAGLATAAAARLGGGSPTGTST